MVLVAWFAKWGSTIKSPSVGTVTSRYPSWCDLRYCKDIKLQPTNQTQLDLLAPGVLCCTQVSNHCLTDTCRVISHCCIVLLRKCSLSELSMLESDVHDSIIIAGAAIPHTSHITHHFWLTPSLDRLCALEQPVQVSILSILLSGPI